MTTVLINQLTNRNSFMSDPIISKVQYYSAILWPTFLVSAVANALLFTLFDPHDFLLEYNLDQIAVYSIGFFFFWGTTILSSSLTCYFLKPCDLVNKQQSTKGKHKTG